MAKAKKPKHVAIAGNIGAGKTTLTELLSKHYRWIPQFEDVDQNPIEISKGTETVIQDRTIYEDAYIFAPNLHEMGLMSKRDFENYFDFFQNLRQMVKPPDLLVYLQASVPTLVGQIQKRGREYEENIRLDYLKRLNEFYNKWIEGYKEGPLLVVNVDENKFAENEEDLGKIIAKIDAELYGLF